MNLEDLTLDIERQIDVKAAIGEVFSGNTGSLRRRLYNWSRPNVFFYLSIA